MFQRILIPLDGSSQAEQAIPVASKIAQETHSHILLVCVINHIHIDNAYAYTNANAKTRTLFEEAQSYLRRISDTVIATVASIETFVAADPAASTILKIATITQTDLIVLSSYGDSDVEQTRGQTFGNVTRALLMSSHIPILVRQVDGTLIYLKQALQSLTVTYV